MTLRTSLRVGGDASEAKAALKETEAGLKKVKQGAGAASDALAKSSRSHGGAAGAIEKGTKASDGFAKAQKGAAGHTANLTAQLNDIGVMLAAGQNPMQLALQQGTQINQVFAQMGGGQQALRGIAGAFTAMLSPINLATLGIIAFGAMGTQALLSLISDSRSFEDALEDLSGGISEYIDLIGKADSHTAELFDVTRAKIEATSKAHQDLIAIAKIETFNDLEATIESLAKSATNYAYTVGKVGDAGDLLGIETQLEGNITIWKQKRSAVRGFIDELEAMRSNPSLDEQYHAAVRVRDIFKSTVDTSGDMSERQIEFWKNLSRTIYQMELLGAATRANEEDHIRYSLKAQEAAKEELSKIKEQNMLRGAAIQYGKDTLFYQSLKAQSALDLYRTQVAQRDISEEMKSQLISAFARSQDLAVSSWENEQALRASEVAARNLARALDAASGFSTDLGGQIRVLQAEITALESGANATIAKQLEADRVRAASLRDASLAAGAQAAAVDEVYQNTLAQIDTKAQLLAQQSQLVAQTKAQERAVKSATREYEKMLERVKKLNLDADPVAQYKAQLQDLDALLTAGLSDTAYAQELERLNEEIADSVPLIDDVASAWADFLVDGARDFGGFKNAVLGSFKSLLAEMITTAARNQILISVGLGNVGGSVATSAAGSLLGGAGGGTGLLGGLLGKTGTLTTGGGLGSTFASLAGGTGFMGGLGQSLAAGFGTTGSIGGLFSVGGNAAAVGGGFMASLGAAVPVLGAVASAISFFRSKTKELDNGLRLTARGTDIAAESFRKLEKSRFWGLSKKTVEEFSSIDNGPFQETYDAVFHSVSGMAAELGIGSSAFEDFTHEIKLSLKGLDHEAKQLAIAKAITGLSDSLAEAALGAGHTTADLQNLVQGLTVANTAFELLGMTTYEASVVGAQAAQNMLAHFESLDAFSWAVRFYHQNFYSEAERMDTSARAIEEILSELGFSTLPRTRAQFRMLVDAMREVGADEAVASLLKVAPAFAEIEAAWRTSLESIIDDAEAKLETAERAAQNAYSEALRAINGEKQAILDEWNGLLDAAQRKTKEAASRLEGDIALITRVFDSASAALDDLMSVASDRAQESQAVVDTLLNALSRRALTGETALQERARALQTVENGDRSTLDAALNVLSRDASLLYADNARYQLSLAQETAAMETLLAETQGQLTIEEQTLASLQEQSGSISGIRETINEQTAIAKGQLSVMKDAVEAIYGTGGTQLSALEHLIAVAAEGDTVAQARLTSVVTGVDLTTGVMEFVNRGVSELADARQQEEITRDAANAQISSAEASANSQLEALNESVSGILKLDTSIAGVGEAISLLDDSILNLTSAQREMGVAEARHAEMLREQSRAQTVLMAQLLEAQRINQIGTLQSRLEKAVKDLGAAPEVLEIVRRVGRGRTWYGKDKSSYVTLSDGQNFHSKSGGTSAELAHAERLAQPSIQASLTAFNTWQANYNRTVEPLREQIQKLGGTPSFAGGGWTGNGPRHGGLDGRGGFYSILHPQEMVFDTTLTRRVPFERPGKTGSMEMLQELAGLRREVAGLNTELGQIKQLQSKTALNTTRLAQKARDDERHGALVEIKVQQEDGR